jgi:hypothetical protein
LRKTETEHRLRLFAIGWYVLGWLPCVALNSVGVPGKICLGLYAACGMVVYMAGVSILRERSDARDRDATSRDRLREIEQEYDEGQ